MSANFRRGAEAAEQSGSAKGLSRVLSLPSRQKHELTSWMLDHFGATNVTKKGDEYTHSCILPLNGHANGDRNPSASLNAEKLTYRCLAGETLVKTMHGDVPIEDLSGDSHLLMDGTGKWVECEVRSFGVQSLRRVTLSRNGFRREVYATPEHRWLLKRRDGSLREVETDDLRPDHRVPSVFPMVRLGRTHLSRDGVRAGFVFGDGTATPHGCVAYFYGDKDAEVRQQFFADDKVREVPEQGRVEVRSGLPRSWKSLPALDEGASYLYGWLAGYFAADGSVHRGLPRLASASRDTLLHVQAICNLLGIATYDITEQVRDVTTPNGRYYEGHVLYSLSFVPSTLTEEFFLLSEHRQRFSEADRAYERTGWTVISVEETDRVEEVFCAVVPTTHSFVLAGNILTGNCWSCGSGGLLWFVQTMTGLDQQEAVRFLLGEIDTSRVESLADLLEFIESTLSPKQTYAEPIPHYDPRVLHPWLVSMPTSLIDERKIARDNLVAMGVGHDPERDRAIIPHFWDGELVGWQSRRLDERDGSPKYLSTPGMPKDTTLFNHDRSAPVVLVVESPMTVVAKHHVGDPNWVATFGSRVTDAQIKHIARHQSVLLWMDNDPAGWLATEQLIDALLPLTTVNVVESYWEQDPADLPDDEVERLLGATLPAALWQRPVGRLSSYREGRSEREHEEVRDRWEAGRHPGAAS